MKKQKMTRKEQRQVAIIFLLLFLGVLGITYYYLNSKTNSQVINDNNDSESTIGTYEVKKVLYLYLSPNNEQIITSATNNYDNLTLLGSYNCQTENCTFNDSMLSKKIVLIKDNDFYNYNYETKLRTKIKISNEEQYLSLGYIYDNDTLLGYKISTSNGWGYYSFDAKKIIVEPSYDSLTFDKVGIEDNKLYGIKTIGDCNQETSIIGLYTGNIESIVPGYVMGQNIDNTIFYLADTSCVEGGYYSIYNHDLKQIIPGSHSNYDISKYYIYTYDDKNIYYKYDHKGNLIEENKDYLEIINISSDEQAKTYVTVIDQNHNLLLLDENKNIIKDYGNLNYNYSSYALINKYYKESKKDNIYYYGKGIYLFIINDDLNGNDKKYTEYYYLTDTGSSGSVSLTETELYSNWGLY